MQLPGGSTKHGSPMKLSNPCSGQRLQPLRAPPFPGLPLSQCSAFLSPLRPSFPRDPLRLYRPEECLWMWTPSGRRALHLHEDVIDAESPIIS